MTNDAERAVHTYRVFLDESSQASTLSFDADRVLGLTGSDLWVRFECDGEEVGRVKRAHVVGWTRLTAKGR